MTPTTPDPTKFILPAGTRTTTFQPPVGMADCDPLPVIKTPQHVVSTWMPTPGELALLAEGVPVTLVIFGGGMPPVSLMVGGADLR